MIILKCKVTCKLASSISGYWPVAGSCELGKLTFGLHKIQYLHQRSDYQLLKYKCSTACVDKLLRCSQLKWETYAAIQFRLLSSCRPSNKKIMEDLHRNMFEQVLSLVSHSWIWRYFQSTGKLHVARLSFIHSCGVGAKGDPYTTNIYLIL
jgi:hypothetical protein